ncbi:PKD domain-containing protein [Streptomyces sp. DSM 116496]|uniref:PKD domain-containing protein n=1 Tax=Streptomyces stoeckheimensis TaxID=3344656 RepID=UPI0038B2AE9E
MSHRRLVASATILAAGISLIPGLANAADSEPGKVQGVSTPDLDSAIEAKTTKFDSPADRSVKVPSAGKSKAAGTLAASEGNPDLAVALHGTTFNAHSLELSMGVTSADVDVELTIDWGDGTSGTASAHGTESAQVEHVYREVGTYRVKVKVTDAVNGVSAENSVTVTTEGSDFTPYTPTRLLDTRTAGNPVLGYKSARVKVGGFGTIPAGVTAVALNVTVTNTFSPGHITAFASGTERPTTSNLNFEPGQTVPNQVIVPVGADGYVELYNGTWLGVDLIADITGYFTQSAASGYTGISPERHVDTREGLGTRKGQIPGYGTITTKIAGNRGVPAGAKAVALNVTVTNPRSDGHLTVFPAGKAAPNASNLNFTTGQTIANSVIVPVGTDGKISIRNGGWNPADVIVDVVGYYSPDSVSAYLPFAPERVKDTRENKKPLPGRYYSVLGLGDGYPNTTGFVLNTTVTNTRGAGFLAVAPDPNTIADYKNGTNIEVPIPTSSNLNFTANKTVPNLVQAGRGNTGVLDFFNWSDADIDLIVDIFGIYMDN